jgi:predicted nucleic acid-binding protein
VTAWLLDTNVLSEIRRPKPDRRVVSFVASQPLDFLYVSAVTLADIRFIAATALQHGLTVVSRDVTDYARARVPIFNPWVDSVSTYSN